jgi:Family of unknown function (DUF6073)
VRAFYRHRHQQCRQHNRIEQSRNNGCSPEQKSIGREKRDCRYRDASPHAPERRYGCSWILEGEDKAQSGISRAAIPGVWFRVVPLAMRSIMAIQVKPHTVPQAGVDIVDITLRETYHVEGVGEDTVLLKGELEAHRGAPLLGPGKTSADWETSTVVANFVNLSLTGESKVFGPVRVTLDRSMPSIAAVGGGHCKAAIALRVTMPQHNLSMRSKEPVQLYSEVETVPPIGDEKTESVAPVDLVDVQTNRVRGKMVKAVVAWRELIEQRAWGSQ